jgi:hypothetical protein
MEGAGFDDRAARNLLAYPEDEVAASGSVPDDCTIVVDGLRSGRSCDGRGSCCGNGAYTTATGERNWALERG